MTIRPAILTALASIALVVPGAVPAAPARPVMAAAPAKAPLKAPSKAPPKALAQFGPFVVLAADRARLVDVTDSESPADFLAMIEAYPALRALELVDCPGTRDDIANLRLGRLIRQHGIATIAPAQASVRSGAVDIFLAGASRKAAADARFAVHSWLSADGREASSDRSADPARAAYVRYYRDMGMADGDARAFYALTVSVPNSRTLQLAPRDLARYAKVTTAS